MINGRIGDRLSMSGGPRQLLPFFSIKTLISGSLPSVNPQSFPNPWSRALRALVRIPGEPRLDQQLGHYSSAVTVICEDRGIGAELYVPFMRVMCQSLVEFANESEMLRDGIMDTLRKMWGRASRDTGARRAAIPAILNGGISVNILRRDFAGADGLLRNSKKEVSDNSLFTVGEMASFAYLRGRVNLVFGRLKDAKESLDRAFGLIPTAQRWRSDRRLVASFLLPLNLNMGVVPSPQMMETYGLGFYAPLVNSVLNGDLRAYDEFVCDNELSLIRMGVWEVVSLTRRLVEARLLQMVHASMGTNQVPVEVWRKVLSQYKECSKEEAEFVVCNLAHAKLVKANVADSAGVIVFAPKNPFPMIAE